MNLVMQFFGNINPNIFLDSDPPPQKKRRRREGEKEFLDGGWVGCRGGGQCLFIKIHNARFF